MLMHFIAHRSRQHNFASFPLAFYPDMLVTPTLFARKVFARICPYPVRDASGSQLITTHTHAHTRIHTHTLTRTHAYTHTHTHTRMLIPIYSLELMPRHVLTHYTCMRARKKKKKR